MLNSDALDQLTQLKQTIRANKDYAQGLIRGTKGKFGFVILDDGREAFLDPDQMQRVFPGDRVEVSVSQNDKQQWEATLEKLIQSDLKEFVGYYLERGKGHFIVPDVHSLNRWIFLPPKGRSSAKNTDYIRAKLTRHPFTDGKSQAKVIEVIGKRDDQHIERRYILNKYQLPDSWSEQQAQQVESIVAAPTNQDFDGLSRKDLTQLPLVTIDAETTLDMDDAVFAQATESGWQLTVAIADPTAGIALDSPLGQEALKRGQTVYLPGQSTKMMPEQLSHGSYSLVAGETRPAMVTTLSISKSGEISHYEFCLAEIRSAAKLSYQQVSLFLDKEEETSPLAEPVKESLNALHQLANARFAYREKHCLVMEDRPDYDYQVNDAGKITAITKLDRNSAQRLVEECMLATNLVAGMYFAEHNLPALFSSHLGFKPDRLKQVNGLLESDIGEIPEDLSQLDTYLQLIQKLQANPEYASLLAVLKRQLRPSELTTEATPHLGLGFPVYANMTSPIRRFNDLYNHLIIKQSLGGPAIAPLADEQLETLKAQNSNGRSACRQLEQWLICQYMQAFIGQTFSGTIAMVNSQGIGVKLSDNGVDTFIQLRDRKNKQQKVEFNPDRLTLQIDGNSFVLEQPAQVTITGIDEDRRQVLAVLASTEDTQEPQP